MLDKLPKARSDIKYLAEDAAYLVTEVLKLDNIGADVKYFYDPFGSPLPGSTPPANALEASYGFGGPNEKLTETDFALAPILMGARIYLPGIGRKAG